MKRNIMIFILMLFAVTACQKNQEKEYETLAREAIQHNLILSTGWVETNDREHYGESYGKICNIEVDSDKTPWMPCMKFYFTKLDISAEKPYQIKKVEYYFEHEADDDRYDNVYDVSYPEGELIQGEHSDIDFAKDSWIFSSMMKKEDMSLSELGDFMIWYRNSEKGTIPATYSN